MLNSGYIYIAGMFTESSWVYMLSRLISIRSYQNPDQVPYGCQITFPMVRIRNIMAYLIYQRVYKLIALVEEASGVYILRPIN